MILCHLYNISYPVCLRKRQSQSIDSFFCCFRFNLVFHQFPQCITHSFYLLKLLFVSTHDILSNHPPLVLFDDQNINFFWFGSQLMFLLKNQMFGTFLQFDLNLCEKCRMPLNHFCFFFLHFHTRPPSFVKFRRFRLPKTPASLI